MSKRTNAQVRTLVKAEIAQESWHMAFIEALSMTGNISAACRAVSIGRRTAYQARERLVRDVTDEHGNVTQEYWFRDLWEEAIETFADSLHDEIIRRGRDGWLEPVIYKGQPQFVAIGQDPHGNDIRIPVAVRKFDSTLLIFEMKRLRPEEYRDRASLELSGTITTESEADRALAEALAEHEALARKSATPVGTAEDPGSGEAEGT